jgi:hypothetical protein
MVAPLAVVVALLFAADAALAQAPTTPIPLVPEAAPRTPEPTPPDRTLTPPPIPDATARVFCGQTVPVHVADRDSVSERYRAFVGIWSDAAWTPLLCAALIVENVAPDGTATIVYAFGPIGSNTRQPGGVLNGIGIVRNGELRFQNSDGSQFAFRPLYADLDGELTTPQGQTYRAVFKKTP